ncbi:MAG: hypothetical protein HY722_12955 [Planctomycetes bacterium]|nr:hypothetical protein [Planctomycetota bacterium]
MADGLTCDRCGKSLLAEEDVRYVVEIRVWAAYDPLELTREDLARDLGAELRRTLGRLEGVTALAAEDQVARLFRFDLCPPCQRHYLERPLPPPLPPP